MVTYTFYPCAPNGIGFTGLDELGYCSGSVERDIDKAYVRIEACLERAVQMEEAYAHEAMRLLHATIGLEAALNWWYDPYR